MSFRPQTDVERQLIEISIEMYVLVQPLLDKVASIAESNTHIPYLLANFDNRAAIYMGMKLGLRDDVIEAQINSQSRD